MLKTAPIYHLCGQEFGHSLPGLLFQSLSQCCWPGLGSYLKDLFEERSASNLMGFGAGFSYFWVVGLRASIPNWLLVGVCFPFLATWISLVWHLLHQSQQESMSTGKMEGTIFCSLITEVIAQPPLMYYARQTQVAKLATLEGGGYPRR